MPYEPSKKNDLMASALMCVGFLGICVLGLIWMMTAFTSEDDCYEGGYSADDPICQRVLQDESR